MIHRCYQVLSVLYWTATATAIPVLAIVYPIWGEATARLFAYPIMAVIAFVTGSLLVLLFIEAVNKGKFD